MSRILLLLFAGLKFGKLFGLVASMVLSIGVYALLYGWRYAVGIVSMILIHESGHYLAGRQRGLRMGLPTILPFVGWTKWEDKPPDAETLAYVGLGGPLIGTLGALGCYFLARNYHEPWLLAVAYVGFFINLLNLIPIPPLDGGVITAVLSPRIWIAGAVVLAMMLWYRFSPILLVVAIVAIPNIIAAFRYREDDPAHKGFFTTSLRVRWEYGIYYVVLLAFLAVMTNETSEMLHAGTFEPTQQESQSI